MFSSIRVSCLSVGVVHGAVGSGLRARRVLASVPKVESKKVFP